MADQKQVTPSSTQSLTDEYILVVRRDDLFGNDAWQGLRTEGLDGYLKTIFTQQHFLPRSLMESDPTYKQVIPYVVFTFDGKYFLMQRAAKASETRLASKMSLGIGGHVRKEDIEGKDLLAWAEREFNEEVSYDGGLTLAFVGLLNDDSNDVGKVHVGLVMLATGDSGDISVKSELKGGSLVSLDECMAHHESLEGWSRLIVEYLKTHKE